jgi:hypothetical protein
VIGVSSLMGGPVEKLCVSVTLLEPLDARFFSPHDLFLGFPFFQLLAYLYFLFLEVFRDPLLSDLSLYDAHFFH